MNLPINGGTSLLMLLRMAGFPKDSCDFIEATRILRNTFAHNIRQIDESLMTVIMRRNDKSKMLKIFCFVEEYDEEEFVKLIKQDSGILRFGILSSTLHFLMMSYHVAIK